MLLEELEVEAGLIGGAVVGVVEAVLGFSSIGEERVKGHSSERLIEVAAVIEVLHHSVRLREACVA